MHNKGSVVYEISSSMVDQRYVIFPLRSTQYF